MPARAGRNTCPVSSPSPRLATWADVAGYPEGTRVEVLDGEVVFAPSPAPAHQGIGARILRRIGGPFDEDDEPGGWWILPEVDVELGPHRVLQPDVAGWRRERVPAFPNEQPIRIAPDGDCEILSPAKARRDRLQKAAIYLDSGVPFLWIIDPAERLLEAYKAREQAWLRLGAWSDEDVARVAPFGAVELKVGRLFPPGP